jgi:hypothetical protein
MFWSLSRIGKQLRNLGRIDGCQDTRLDLDRLSGQFFILALFFQKAWGVTPFETGFVFLPMRAQRPPISPP